MAGNNPAVKPQHRLRQHAGVLARRTGTDGSLLELGRYDPAVMAQRELLTTSRRWSDRLRPDRRTGLLVLRRL
jgi:hypothetical protein